MGKIYSSLDPRLQEFIQAQHLFFVGTAPLGSEEHVNISPKGLATFRILGPNQVAYLDYVGSGAETIAHLRENGRIVLMFCAFQGPPNIVRLHGRGQVIEPQDRGFKDLLAQFDPGPGVRCVIRIEVTRISDSCGYSVPLYRHEKDRTQLGAWAQRKGPDGLIEYQKKLNSASIDGLPALRWVENPDPRYPIGPFDPYAQVDRSELLEQFAAMSCELREVVAGLSPERLDTPYREGGWTVRQVVHHLADAQMNWYLRTKLALTEDSPVVKPFDEVAWAETPESRTGPIEPSLLLLEGLYGRWVALYRSLTEEQWSRTMVHPDRGVFAINTSLAMHVWHGKHHIAHITTLRDRLLTRAAQ